MPNTLKETFVLHTEEMQNSVMERHHRTQNSFLSRFTGSKNLLASIGAGTGLFSISTGLSGNKDIIVIDISYWQDPTLIDYDALCENIDGVILRATYGVWEDTAFKIHYMNFKQRGIAVGAYAYLIGNHLGTNQASVFLEVTEGLDLEMGFWADVEDQRIGTALSKTVADAFISKIEVKSETPINVYTGVYAWYAIMGANAGYENKKLWLANYQVISPKLPVYGKWDSWWLWQYTDSGTHDGYFSHIDTNKFCCDSSLYWEWVNQEDGGDNEPVDLPIENYLFKATCIAGALYVRNGPSSNDVIVGGLTYGNIVEVYEVADNGWYRIGVAKWCSGNPTYMQKIENSEPEEPIEIEPTLEERMTILELRIDALEIEVSQIKNEFNISS